MCYNLSDHKDSLVNLLNGWSKSCHTTSVSWDVHVDIKPGTEISHYRIESLIGSGSNGEIYLAKDMQLGRNVAIKILMHQADHDLQNNQSFLKEAQTAAALNHPNIVTIYEIGLFEQRPFIVMEQVEGQTLDLLAEGQSLSEEELIKIISQVCKGLSAAHSAGFVHRDIKLSNVILDQRGDVKILDFGLATALSALPKNEEKLIEGTIRYMAPEILTGKPASPRSDLFSVGAMFYHLLTGRPAFSGQYEAAVKYSIMNELPPPVSTLRSSFSPKLDLILNKLLEKDVEKRYQSASDVINDLQEYLAENPNLNTARKFHTTTIGKLLLFTLFAVAFLVTTYLWQFGSVGLDNNNTEVVSLAVLPFENMGDSTDSYFADGITDEIARCLSRQDELKVISRRSSMLYRDSESSMSEISKQLNVSYFVVGTVQRQRDAGDSVKITAALISNEDDSYLLWSESYFRSLDNIFEVQSEIAMMVSEALQISIAKDRPHWQMAPTADLKAYDYYLLGNKYFHRSWTKSDIEMASELYDKAIEQDNTFALAYAMLSRSRSSMYWEYYNRTEKNRSAALLAAEKAISLQPDLPEGYAALGYYYYHCERKFEKALVQFQYGLRINKNNAELHNAVAVILRRQAKLDESIACFLKALELDPRSHLKSFDVALTYGMMRKYDDSRAYLERTLDLAPDYSLGYIYCAWLPILESGDTRMTGKYLSEAIEKTDLSGSRYYWWLRRFIDDSDSSQIVLNPGADTVAYYLYRMRMNRYSGDSQNMKIYADSARLNLEKKLATISSDPRYLSSYALAMSGLGDKESAISYAQKAVSLLPLAGDAFDAPFLLLNQAEVFVMFEEYDLAVEYLNEVISIPGFASPAYLWADPMWAPLHDNARFRKIAGFGNQSDSSEVIP